MLTTSLVIPTYNRPDELRVALGSVLQQTRLPDQLVIIDDGQMESVPYADELEDAGVRIAYQRKAIPDLPTSRNIGIGLSDCDLVLFLDDDVKLADNYIEELIRPLEEDEAQQVAGVGARITNYRDLRPAHRLRRLFDRIFLVSGAVEGRVLPSGFTTNYGSTFDPPDSVYEVDVLSGGAAAWRRWVFEKFSFTENYRVHCAGEDQDFSYRVSRQYTLLFNPAATMEHYESPTMRHDRYRSAQRFLFDRYRFFNNYVRRHPLQVVLFWWAVSGYVLSRAAVWLIKRTPDETQRMRGIRDALGLMISGNLPWLQDAKGSGEVN